MRMAKVNVYLPEDLARTMKAAGVSPSTLLQEAIKNHVRPKPIRVTVDLAPDDYEFLRTFAHAYRCSHSKVLRDLLTELRETYAADPDLAARIIAK